MKLKIYFFSVLCFATVVSSYSQSILDSLVKSFDHYREDILHEKLYLHINQTTLFAGEILWFKVYVLDATFHKPIDVSKVAYIEVIDRTNQPLLQAKISLENGMGSGSLYLPATIQTGSYYIRGYTRWMTNSPPAFYFHQQINIINTLKADDITTSLKNRNEMVRIFPEGGHLVSDVDNTVAIQLLCYGDSCDSFKGEVLDSHGTVVTAVESIAGGIGKFTLQPKKDRTYTLSVVDAMGRTHKKAFPEILPVGFTMAVQDEGNSLSIKVASTFTDWPVVLFIHSRNKIVYAQMIYQNQIAKNVVLKKEIFPEGVSHITLFDSKLTPVCERIFYKPFAQKQSQLRIEAPSQSFKPREKVTLTIQSDSTVAPHQQNLSVSVYKVNTFNKQLPIHIDDYLYLHADVENINPASITSSNSPELIDLLMLTKGWRRFKWDDVLKDSIYTSVTPEFRGHTIEGTLKNTNGKPAKSAVMFLSSPDKRTMLSVCRTNSAGAYKYEVENFYGKRKIIIQPDFHQDSTYHIEFNDPFSREFLPLKLSPITLVPQLQEELIGRSVGVQVQHTFYESEMEKFQPIQVDSFPFFGTADEIYYLDQYTRFPVMEEVMREYVRGVLVRKRKDGFQFLVSDPQHKRILEGEPLILIDGVPIFDVDQIMAIDPRRIEKLEVVNQRYFLGPLMADGIISYTSYSGTLNDIELDPSVFSIDYEGLQRARKFFSPDYNAKEKDFSNLPDQRFQLYWNADLRKIDSKDLQIEFFTSDIVGDFVVQVEGITSEGVPLTGRYRFKVLPR